MKRKYYRYRDPDYVEHLMNITSADDPLFFKPHVWQDMRCMCEFKSRYHLGLNLDYSDQYEDVRWLRRQERINSTKGTEPPASDSGS